MAQRFATRQPVACQTSQEWGAPEVRKAGPTQTLPYLGAPGKRVRGRSLRQDRLHARRHGLQHVRVGKDIKTLIHHSLENLAGHVCHAQRSAIDRRFHHGPPNQLALR